MSKPQRKEAVIRFATNEGGWFYTRPFDVGGVVVLSQGARALVAGGRTVGVQETLPEIFRRLGWEQSV